MQDIPTQTSDSDCGVFVLSYARCVVFDKPFSFNQVSLLLAIVYYFYLNFSKSDMPNIRKWFSLELQNFSIINPNKEYFYDDGNADDKALQTREELTDTSKCIGEIADMSMQSVTNVSKQDVTNIKNLSEEIDVVLKQPEEVANMSRKLTDRSKQPEEVANKSTQSQEVADMLNPEICIIEPGVNEVEILAQSDSSAESERSEFDTDNFHSMAKISNVKSTTQVTQVQSWDQLQSSLQAVFPNDKQYSYVVESYKELPFEEFIGAPTHTFQAQIRINIGNESDAKEWLSKVYAHSKCTYRHTRGVGNKTKGKRILYKAYLHCQHQRKPLTMKQTAHPKKKSSKQSLGPLRKDLKNKKTSCPSTIKLTVNVPTKKDKKAAKFRPYLLSHTTVVSILHNHNHPIDSLHALTFHTISEDAKDAYYQLFSCGHSAASAWHSYETKLMIENEENKMEMLADRSINPSPQDVSRLFDKWREEQLGPENGPKMFDMLDDYVKNYNLHNRENGGCILVSRYDAKPVHEEASSDDEEVAAPPKKKLKQQTFKKETPMSVVICTPLMARVHEYVPQAREMMYVDSSSSMDRYNLSVFLLSTSHSGGALPLGAMIVSDESATTVQDSLSQLLTILPKKAFFNAENGPNIIMTDDCESQRQALTATWPKAKMLLCVFHVLQAFWTWLHDGKNKVHKEHRQVLMSKIKELVYAQSEQTLNSKYQQLASDSTVKLYPKFVQHIKNYWPKRERWALCFRSELMTRGNNTNNYAEAGIKVLKEQVFSRIKAYNLLEMVSFVIDVMEMYYQRRLLHLANNQIDRYITLRFCGLKLHTVPLETIKRHEGDLDHIFYVNSRSERGLIYTIDMHLGTCSCPQGINGAPCSHQAAISKYFHIYSINSIPTLFPERRRELATIALGKEAKTDLACYASIHQKADEATRNAEESCLSDKFINAWKIVKEDAKDACNDEPNEEAQVLLETAEVPCADMPNALEVDLSSIFRDLRERVSHDTSGQLQAGLQKFCNRYKQMCEQTFSNNRIASAFNKFGWVFGGNATSFQGGVLRRGRRIAVQATAAGRRRKTLSRGKSKAPSGRPLKSELQIKRTESKEQNRYFIPPRNMKPPKRLHSLSTNVSLCQQNAGKW